MKQYYIKEFHISAHILIRRNYWLPNILQYLYIFAKYSINYPNMNNKLHSLFSIRKNLLLIFSLCLIVFSSCEKEDIEVEQNLLGTWYVNSVYPQMSETFFKAGDRLVFCDDMVLEIENRWDDYYDYPYWEVSWDKIFHANYLKLSDDEGVVFYGEIEWKNMSQIILHSNVDSNGPHYKVYLSR